MPAVMSLKFEVSLWDLKLHRSKRALKRKKFEVSLWDLKLKQQILTGGSVAFEVSLWDLKRSGIFSMTGTLVI